MKTFRIAGAAVAAVALIGLAQSPASAATDVTVYGYNWGSCAHVSTGHFASYGEVFTLYDSCAEGMAAVMKVDIAPYKANGGYDFDIWNTNGASGSPMTVNKEYAEDTGVCIQVGAGEYASGEWGNWGNWSCGKA
ncbi:hypothetical protein PV664_36930 [Streptomyces sp. ME01-18a]|uniref:hypothetical protein n=1 Tax=Streptomyces sp. ME01-18a TaxID=3028669 RepID=UPI0029BD7D31|nr:hypothetical protein [Streptomyces sp. ME01-18a]MDX3434394.1 hypothetical protein [Streptomyces sp. ME01-18a]